MLTRLLVCAVVTAAVMTPSFSHADETFELILCRQYSDATADGGYRPEHAGAVWPASHTALIVCDVWDAHHCLNAVKRLNEFAPRLNDVVKEARRRGATIIHAPSDCMEAYTDHPARKRALAVPPSANLPDDITSWCSSIPAEEKVKYPIDQSDGGEDDDPTEHEAWAQELTARGLNPRAPWKQQLDTIEIDAERDFITDRGDEVWSILEARGIDHVILTGVHVNMCVLGRPFGLRQLSKNGKQVVLMRDMTDSMYNPAAWPFVSHFEGTRRVISHIEQHICPTITSDQLIGGEPFQFAREAGVAR
jgi:nicotinamidase-related amidase